jgi:hypothetical protein
MITNFNILDFYLCSPILHGIWPIDIVIRIGFCVLYFFKSIVRFLLKAKLVFVITGGWQFYV